MRFLKYILVVAVLVSGGIVFLKRMEIRQEIDSSLRAAGFIVEEIDLYGRQNTSISSIEEAAGIRKGDNIFSIDMKRVQKNLENLAWVEQASIYRVLPDTVVIRIKEYIPLVIWQNKGKHYLVSDKGDVLKVSVSRFKHLPIVIGEGAPAKVSEIVVLIGENAPSIQPRIKALVFEGGRRWNLVLDDIDNGLEVKLPEENVEISLNKLSALASTENILDRNLSVIDLRFQDKMTVKFHKPAKGKKKQDS